MSNRCFRLDLKSITTYCSWFVNLWFGYIMRLQSIRKISVQNFLINTILSSINFYFEIFWPKGKMYPNFSVEFEVFKDGWEWFVQIDRIGAYVMTPLAPFDPQLFVRGCLPLPSFIFDIIGLYQSQLEVHISKKVRPRWKFLYCN